MGMGWRESSVRASRWCSMPGGGGPDQNILRALQQAGEGTGSEVVWGRKEKITIQPCRPQGYAIQSMYPRQSPHRGIFQAPERDRGYPTRSTCNTVLCRWACHDSVLEVRPKVCGTLVQWGYARRGRQECAPTCGTNIQRQPAVQAGGRAGLPGLLAAAKRLRALLGGGRRQLQEPLRQPARFPRSCPLLSSLCSLRTAACPRAHRGCFKACDGRKGRRRGWGLFFILRGRGRSLFFILRDWGRPGRNAH